MIVSGFKKVAIIVFVLLLVPKLEAQETFSKVTGDFESWNSIRLKAKFNKKFTAGFEQGLRLNENAASFDQALSEVTFGYKLAKGLEIGVGSRYIYNQTKNDNFENNFRLHFDASYKVEVKRLDMKLRVRLQNKRELNIGESDIDDAASYARIKFQTGYNIKKWKFDPQFSTEIFRNLESGGSFDKYRLTVGTDYRLKKLGEIGIFYRFEREMNTTLPKTTYIAGLKYTYTIKPFKK